MSQNEWRPRIDGASAATDETTPERFTPQSLLVIPLCGLGTAFLPLVMYVKFRQVMPGVGLAEAMATSSCIGMLAAAVLVAHSFIRSPFWANVVLWGGAFFATLAFCILFSMLTR